MKYVRLADKALYLGRLRLVPEAVGDYTIISKKKKKKTYMQELSNLSFFSTLTLPAVFQMSNVSKSKIK